MNDLLRNPRFWLLAQMLLLVIAGGPLGLWSLETQNDSGNYVSASEMSFDQSMRFFRTQGFPLVLRLIRTVSPDFRILPWVHFAALCLATFLLDHAVRRFGGSRWQAFAVSTGAFWGMLQNRAIATLLTDFSGIVLAVTTVAFLLLVATDPRRSLPWIGLTLSAAYSYHIRPPYLFLVPLVPLLGVIFLRLRRRGTDETPSQRSFAAALGVAAAVPLLGFCLLRLFTVGHFGLVSVAGLSAVGFTAELLQDETYQAQLSEEFHPLARDILGGRRRHGMQSVFLGGAVVRMRQWELRFNDNIYQVVFPVACRRYGEDRMVLNEKLTRFNRELMLHNKAKCLLYFIYSYPRSVAKLFYCSWIRQVLCPMLLILFAVRLWIYRGRPTPTTPDGKPARRRALQMLFCTALLFYLAKSTLVFLSFTAASRRYMLPAGVFVPSLVALLILRELELIAARCKGNRG